MAKTWRYNDEEKVLMLSDGHAPDLSRFGGNWRPALTKLGEIPDAECEIWQAEDTNGKMHVIILPKKEGRNLSSPFPNG